MHPAISISRLKSKRGIAASFSMALPRVGLASLSLCLVSGIILTFHYRPFGDVFRNVEEITSVVPYGWFFRQIHYITGQAFVFLILLHTADHFIRRRYRLYPAGEWFSLITALVTCFLALFTGFVLKGDKEGLFAGTILSNIIETIPLIGEALSRLFVGRGEDFFFLPCLHHYIFLPLLAAYLIRKHVIEWLPGHGYFACSLALAVAYAVLVPPWTDIPPQANEPLVTGPWFFLGIQSLLKSWPPLYAGIILPSALLGLLIVIRVISVFPNSGRQEASLRFAENALYWIILAAAAVYLVLTINAGINGP